MYWTLVDNFEWNFGFTMRVGGHARGAGGGALRVRGPGGAGAGARGLGLAAAICCCVPPGRPELPGSPACLVRLPPRSAPACSVQTVATLPRRSLESSSGRTTAARSGWPARAPRCCAAGGARAGMAAMPAFAACLRQRAASVGERMCRCVRGAFFMVAGTSGCLGGWRSCGRSCSGGVGSRGMMGKQQAVLPSSKKRSRWRLRKCRQRRQCSPRSLKCISIACIALLLYSF